MKKVKITAIRKVQYDDLMAKYENRRTKQEQSQARLSYALQGGGRPKVNPIEHTCDVCEGQSWGSEGGKCPDGLCPEAWKTMKEFVEALARGEGNFYDGWKNRRTKQEQSQARLSYALQGEGRPIGQNPYSAMISCNDGFRPVSFYIETIE